VVPNVEEGRQLNLTSSLKNHHRPRMEVDKLDQLDKMLDELYRDFYGLPPTPEWDETPNWPPTPDREVANITTEDVDEEKLTCQLSKDGNVLKLEALKKEAIQDFHQELMVAIENETVEDTVGDTV